MPPAQINGGLFTQRGHPMVSYGYRVTLYSILLTTMPFQLCYQFREYPPIPFLVHVCNVRGEEEHHSSLDMRPDLEDRFCAFSVKFSNDSSEIVAS